MRDFPSRRCRPSPPSLWPPPSRAADAGRYKVVQTLRVGGDGGWDYLTVDPAARRLYVTRGTRVMVFDADTLAAVGEIPNTAGVHGVALAPELGRGFASNGKASSVTIFDLKTLKPIEDVKVTGENPDAILYDPFSKQVFAFNGRTAQRDRARCGQREGEGHDRPGGKPEFATTDLAGRVFVNIEDKSEVVALDAGKNEVARALAAGAVRGALRDGDRPREGPPVRRVRQQDDGRRGREDAARSSRRFRSATASMPTRFDPATGLGVQLQRRGEPDRGAGRRGRALRRGERPDDAGRRTMALDEKTHRVFLATAEFGPPPSPTPEQPHPRPSMVPGSFTLLVVAPAP